MRATVLEGPRDVRVEDVPDPVLPGPEGVVVAVERTAICGSDLHLYHDAPTGVGIRLGHEVIGTVAEPDANPCRRVVVQVQIGPADRCPLDPDDDSFGSGEHGVRHVLDPDVARSFEDGGSHTRTLQRGTTLQWAEMQARKHPTMTSTLDHPSTINLPEVADGDIDAFFDFEDLWAVIVWNDDVTTFQTVIEAFVEIFGHTVERADQLAWRIHRTGKAVAAVRPKDEAEAAVHALHRRKISATLSRA